MRLKHPALTIPRSTIREHRTLRGKSSKISPDVVIDGQAVRQALRMYENIAFECCVETDARQ